MASEPLILTLRFDDASFQRLDGMRRRYFPPERNHIPAHLTLFHHLPPEEEGVIVSALREVGSVTPLLHLKIAGMRFLGYGSAYEIACPDLVSLRKGLADRWRHSLTPQDAAGFKPHVTIQNKVSSAEAKRLHEELKAGFEPFEGIGTGLMLWRYLGGPWESAGEFGFGGDRSKAEDRR